MNKSILKNLFIALGFIVLLASQSCMNRSIMFRSGSNYEYDNKEELKINTEYKIGINDELKIAVTSNQGAMLLEGMNENQTLRGLVAVVDFDGTLKLPLLGRVKVEGLTINEVELLIEELYKKYLVEPFVRITIENKRVIMFLGSGGSARVLNLRNKNTTLLEAIAQSGGVMEQGKSHKIKIFRKGSDGQMKVYKINLSKLEYVEDAQIILQGNDVVYIEPRNDVFLNFAQRAAAYFFVINIFLILSTVIN